MAITWNTPVIDPYTRLPTGVVINGSDPLANDLTQGRLADLSVWDHYGRMGMLEASSSGDLVASSGYDAAFTLRLSKLPDLDEAVRDPSQLLYIPVTPEDIAIGHTLSHQAYDVLNSRQTTQLGQMALRTISFSSFFPAVHDPTYCVVSQLDRTPQQSREWMIRAMEERRPLYLYFVPHQSVSVQVMPDKFECFISSFIPSYRAGHPLDVFYDVDLVEHRTPTVARARWRNSAPKYPRSVKKRTTKPGETLLAYAQRMYGAEYGDGWRLILSANPRSGPQGKPTKYAGIPTSAAWQRRFPKRKRATAGKDRLLGGVVLAVPRYQEA